MTSLYETFPSEAVVTVFLPPYSTRSSAGPGGRSELTVIIHKHLCTPSPSSHSFSPLQVTSWGHSSARDKGGVTTVQHRRRGSCTPHWACSGKLKSKLFWVWKDKFLSHPGGRRGIAACKTDDLVLISVIPSPQLLSSFSASFTGGN